jgi:hypothetical protein
MSNINKPNFHKAKIGLILEEKNLLTFEAIAEKEND